MQNAAAAIVRTVAGAAAVSVAFGAPALGDDAAARTIVDAVAARTTSVSSYTASVSLHVAMHSFPFIRATISGSTSYQRPGRYSLRMRTLPVIAGAFQNVSGDAGDPTVWRRNYIITLDRAADVSQGQVALRMTQRQHGQIEHAEAFIDTATMTVTRMEWFYANGGHIAVDYRYISIGSIFMIDQQSAEISMPGIRASATAQMSDYSMQIDLADRTPAHAGTVGSEQQ